LKYGESAAPYFTRICNQIWQYRTVAAEWQDRNIIIPLHKKGDLSECGKRDITLLSVPGNIFASFLLDRIIKAVDKALRQEQVGFTAGRSCNDQIFPLRANNINLAESLPGQQMIVLSEPMATLVNGLM